MKPLSRVRLLATPWTAAHQAPPPMGFSRYWSEVPSLYMYYAFFFSSSDLRPFLFCYQRKQWQPTPVLLPGKSRGWRSLAGCSPWGLEESYTTERLHFHFHALEKEMATHSSVLAWRIPGTGGPGGLPSIGSHRVGHDWRDLAAAAAYMCHVSIWIYTYIYQTFKILTKQVKGMSGFMLYFLYYEKFKYIQVCLKAIYVY